MFDYRVWILIALFVAAFASAISNPGGNFISWTMENFRRKILVLLAGAAIVLTIAVILR